MLGANIRIRKFKLLKKHFKWSRFSIRRLFLILTIVTMVRTRGQTTEVAAVEAELPIRRTTRRAAATTQRNVLGDVSNDIEAAPAAAAAVVAKRPTRSTGTTSAQGAVGCSKCFCYVGRKTAATKTKEIESETEQPTAEGTMR